MIFKPTPLKDAFLIAPDPIEDERGLFARIWCREEFAANGIDFDIRQANLSFNVKRGTLRGLHHQKAPFEEAKLMRCTRGAIYDVIIDLRRTSPTYLQWFGVELTAENRLMLFVPGSFAHGYQTLVDDTEVFYPVSESYRPAHEGGIRWNDPTFDIDWPITSGLIISPKDESWPDFGPSR